MKRILADLSVFGTLHSGGIWNAAEEILNGLLDSAADCELLLLVRSQNREAAEKRFPRCRVFTIPTEEVESAEKLWGAEGCLYRTRLYEPYTLPLCPDVIWLPYTAPYNYYRTSVPTVFTVHDLIPLHEAGERPPLPEQYRDMAEAADRLVSISNFVRDDLVHTLGIAPERIERIYSPVTVDTGHTEPVPELVDTPYILEMNSYEPRKNKQTVLKAFARMQSRCTHHLVFCGAYAEDRALRPLMLNACLMGLTPRVHFLHRVSDGQKNWLLKNASLLVSASVMEGFGRTPVEAAMCAVPVITAGREPLPEATMGLTRYVDDPFDAAGFAAAMEELLACPPEKAAAEAIAGQLREAYAPTAAAQRYLHLFENVRVQPYKGRTGHTQNKIETERT